MRRFPRRDLLLLGLVGLVACGAPTAVAPGALAPPSTRTTGPGKAGIPAAGTGTPVANAESSGQSFVGRLDRSDALVALVVEQRRTLAYVCDGQQLAAWFTGMIGGDALDLRAEDGTRLTANVRSDAAGRIMLAPGGMIRTPDGQERSFATADTRTLDPVAGLYQSQSTVGDTNLTMGVIAMSRELTRGVLWRDEKPNPIGAPTFATNQLTAPVAGIGTFTAFRLTSPP